MHPFIVHFPIAFLMLYALCELLRFQKITVQPFWFYLKASLSIVGVISALAAIITGGMIEAMFRSIPEKNAIVPVHEMWAMITLIIFAIPAIAYLITWMQAPECAKSLERWPSIKKISNTLSPLAKKVLATKIVVPLALIGLVSVSITGGLGGAMVHGINFDPTVAFIYHLFF